MFKGKKIELTIKNIMSSPPIKINKNASVQDAAKLMFNNRIGSVLVVDDEDKLVGIVTERDLVYLVATGKTGISNEYPVWQIMTENPITVRPDETISDAITKMKDIKVRHLPVVDENGKPVGVISMRDVIGLMLALGDILKKE